MMFPDGWHMSWVGVLVIYRCVTNYPKLERLQTASVGQKSRNISAGCLQLKVSLEIAFGLLAGAAAIVYQNPTGTEGSSFKFTHIVLRIQFLRAVSFRASVSCIMWSSP